MGTLCTMDSFWICWHVFSTVSSSRLMEALHLFSASAGPARWENLQACEYSGCQWG